MRLEGKCTAYSAKSQSIRFRDFMPSQELMKLRSMDSTIFRSYPLSCAAGEAPVRGFPATVQVSEMQVRSFVKMQSFKLAWLILRQVGITAPDASKAKCPLRKKLRGRQNLQKIRTAISSK